MKYIVSSWLYLLALFLISQYLFDRANLYQEIWWLDIPMHMLGGFGVGSFFLAIFEYKKKIVTLVHVLVLYGIIALGWEVHEMLRGFTDLTQVGDVLDTLADLCNGAIGTSVAYYLVRRKRT